MQRNIARIFLGISLVGALGIAAMFTLFGYIIATGGLYGNGQFTDTTFLSGLYGMAVLMIGLLPLTIGLLWVKAEFRRLQPSWGLKLLTGTFIAGSALLGALWILSGPSEEEARLIAVLCAPFFAFLVFLKIRTMSGDR